jgi:dolichol-phosphate mannosyltransferase
MSKKAAFALGLILLRLVYLGLPNLFPEEAYYWNYAMHPAFGYLDHPPMVAWLIRLGTALFGNTEFGVRIFALGSSLVSAFFICRLTALLYDRATAGTSFLILQVLPVFFLTGFMMTPDSPLIACWSAALYFLGRVLFSGSSRAWIGFGISLGLGMLSKYTMALLVPSLFVFMVLDPESRVWFRRFQPWLAGMIAAVLFSPVLFWNARHAWVSFAFQTTDRMSAHRQFALHQLLASILVLLTPVGMILAVRLLAAWKRPAGDASPAEWRRGLFARVFTLVPLSVFVIFSLTHKVKLNWTGPVWLALVPALAACLMALPAASGLRRGWSVTVGVAAAVYLGFLQYLTAGIPGVPYAKKIELVPVGWSELGRELDVRREALEKSTGGAVSIIGMDRNFIASEAAFYQKDQEAAARETTGVHLFGGNSLMYRFWTPSAERKGATLLLVALKKSDLERREIPLLSTPAGPVEERWLARGGKRICPYYVQIVSDYKGL